MAFRRFASPPWGMAGSVAAGMVAAILYAGGSPFWAIGTAAAAAAAAFTSEKWKGSLAALAVGAALGAAACALHGGTLATGDIGRRGVGGKFTVEITGNGSAGRAMTSCKIVGEGAREFMLRPPEGVTLITGERCTVTGRLVFPAAPPRVVYLNTGRVADYEGFAGFDRNLVLRGYSGTLYAKSLEKVAPPAGLRAWFFKLRLALSERLAGMLPEREGKVLNAVVFGMSGALGKELNRNFLKSGALHLFSVSGMHIALAAILTCWLCRPLPWKWRNFPVLAVVWFYALLTGANVPAVRAAIMVSTFTVASMAMIRPRPISVWALAMAPVLCYRPFDLYSAGFQFSFLITFFLLLVAESHRRVLKLLRAHDPYMPPTAANHRAGAAQEALFAAVSASVIFLAGLPISLINQNLCTPAAILMNIFLAAYSVLLFPMAGIKILFSGTVIADALADWGAELLCKMAELVSSLYEPAPAITPPVWSVPLYLALLAALLLARGVGVKSLAAVGLAAWLFAVFGLHLWEPPFVLVCSSGGAEFIIAADPASGGAVCFGVPPYKLQPYLNGLLAARGVRRMDLCVVDGTKGVAALNALDPDATSELVVLADKVTARGEANIPKWLPWKIADARSTVTTDRVSCRLAEGSKLVEFNGHRVLLERGAPGTPVKLAIDGAARAELWNTLRETIYVCEF